MTSSENAPATPTGVAPEVSAVAETVLPASFDSFNLSENLTKAMNEMGFTSPTPIQQQALPLLLGDSHDFIGLASTGTGKTAAFGIPLIERISADDKNTQALVLSPTRELALQVAEQLEKLGKYKGVRVVTIYGGASYTTQISGVKRGAHIIVATPGRLIDFLEQKIVKLQNVQTVVLDEADEMISMGFKEDLETILKATHPEKAEKSEKTESARASCKTWLFSATMSADIRRVANLYLTSPKTVQINRSGGLSDSVEQIYYTVKNSAKTEVIGRLLQVNEDFYGLIFCQTKMEVIELTDALNRRGFPADSLHGDRSQKEREVVLKKFRSREVQVVVATDVAARGLDVKDLTHVINYNLPWDTESYVHRIGRTGRNGQKGIAISLINPEQLRSLKRIQMQTRVNMGKGKVPTADDVAVIKIKQVFKKILGADTTSPEYLLALSYVEDLVKDQEAEFKNFSKEEILARFITAFYPQVFIKNDAILDFVGDRIPRELMNEPGGRSSHPPGRSYADRGPRRDYGPRGDSRPPRRDYGSRDGGGDSRPRRDFAPRAEASGDSRPVRREYAPRAEGAGDSRPPRREYAPRAEGGDSRPRREYAPRAEGSGDSRPARREYAPREGAGDSRPPRREYASREDSRPAPRRDFGDMDSRPAPRRSESSEGNPFFKKFGSSAPARREDPKGVTRHRPSDKKRTRD